MQSSRHTKNRVKRVVASFGGNTNQWGSALLLAGWGVGTAITVDTLLYTRLVGNRMRLHQVPVLLAFLGGLALFGPAGMILGPAILAVTVAVLDVWHCRAENGDSAEAPRSDVERAGDDATRMEQRAVKATNTDGVAASARQKVKK